MELFLICVAFLLPNVCVPQDVDSLTGHRFSRELERMDRNGIGAPALQKYYDSLEYSKLNQTDIVRKMTENLEHMFQTLTNQLKEVKKEIEKWYDHFTATDRGIFPQCCVINGTYSPKFRTKVSVNSACVSRSASSVRFPNREIQDVMKKNYNNNPNLLWQYYGGTDGTFLIYPAHSFNPNCFSYDPRLRQYYVATATNKPKDVVIAVDISGVTASRSNYESKTLLVVAREAVQLVIDTLNPNDRIGLVAFNEQSYKPPECLESQLARATMTNKEKLKNFSNQWSSSGTSHYAVGIRAAFSYFNINETRTNGNLRESIILFLAADDNAGDDPLDVIKSENEARNNSITILTYSFGQGVSSYWRDGLRNMSKQVENDRKFGHIVEGTYVHIQNDSRLRSEMASYYTHLPIVNIGDQPVFSLPYVDRRSKETGLITSLCLPLVNSGSLAGVTCTDILLDELFSDFTNFQQGELSYAFMIDGQGRVMVHYLQPTPNVIKDDPDPIDIYTLETNPAEVTMIESMKRGENGNATFKSLRTIPRGVLEYEGIEAREVEADYYWRKVQGTNFSLCVVLGKNDQQSRLRPGQTLLVKEDVFYYHRLDLNSQSTTKCREYERYSTKEKSMVMLTSHAFEKPYEYLYLNETIREVGPYSRYLNNEVDIQNSKLKLRENVKSSVQATHQAEVFWKKNQDQAQFVVWRYLGTRDGHVRVYPAVEIPKDYDHFTRPWFYAVSAIFHPYKLLKSIVNRWRRTIAQKGKYVVISPYVDIWGAGVIVTQCKAVYEGRTSEIHSTADIVEVVQCIDYPYPYFSRMFLNIYPECNNKEYSCMVIDISGFLVIHPSFSAVVDKPDIERKHLGTMERKIMEDLLYRGLIVKENCLDIENKKQLFSYRVQLSDAEDPRNMLSTVGYMIAPVLYSNTYIIIKRDDRLDDGTCCKNSNISPLDYTCTSSGSDCCLCHKLVQYDSCQEETSSGESYHTCSARILDTNDEHERDLELDRIKNLEPCFDARCDTRKNETICYQVAGCSWCVQNENGSNYSANKQCCNIFETCPFGKVQQKKQTNCSIVSPVQTTATPLSSDPLTTETKSSIVTPVQGAAIPPSHDQLIIGIASGAGFGILITIVVVIFCYRRKGGDSNDKTDYITPISVHNDNPAYATAEDIQYLHEDEEKGSHQSNKYCPFQISDGSMQCSAKG